MRRLNFRISPNGVARPTRARSRWTAAIRWMVVVAGLLHPALGTAQDLRGGVPDTLPGAEIESGKLTLHGASGKSFVCISRAFGRNIVWSSYPTKRALMMLKENELDVLFPMGFNAERDQYLQRSEVVVQSRDVWVYKGTRPNLDDKVGLSLGVKLGSPQEDFFTRAGYKNLTLVNSYENMLRMLAAGRVDALALPGEGWDQIAPELAWKAGTETYLQRDAGFYFSKPADAPWVELLNQAIRACRR